MQSLAQLKRQTKARLAQVLRQITELDAAIAECITQEKKLARHHDVLCSIPGLGTVTTTALLTFLPEIGPLQHKQVAMLNVIEN